MRPWAISYSNNINQSWPANSKTLWQSLLLVPKPAIFELSNIALALALASINLVLWWWGHGYAVVVFCSVLVLLAVIDAYSRLLPDALTVPLIWYAWLLGPLGWLTASSATAVIISILLLVAMLYACIRGQNGFGGGDIKLLGAIAAWAGLEAITIVLLLASTLALVWLAGRFIGGYKRNDSVAFGPFIAIAAIWQLLL